LDTYLVSALDAPIYVWWSSNAYHSNTLHDRDRPDERIGIGSCDQPTVKSVAAAFQKENPDFTITDAGSGEGDSSTVYKHIRYRRPGNKHECEVVWGYQEVKREWKIFDKSEPHLASRNSNRPTDKPCT
jgi:hypothetical protein